LEFREFRVIAENAPFYSAFWQKRHVLLCVFAKTYNSASSLNTLYTAESAQFRQQRLVYLRAFAKNAKFNFAFSSKTLKTIQKRTVTKTALSLTSRFRQQRTAFFELSPKTGCYQKL
jgi:hypothetical protein